MLLLGEDLSHGRLVVNKSFPAESSLTLLRIAYVGDVYHVWVRSSRSMVKLAVLLQLIMLSPLTFLMVNAQKRKGTTVNPTALHDVVPNDKHAACTDGLGPVIMHPCSDLCEGPEAKT